MIIEAQWSNAFQEIACNLDMIIPASCKLDVSLILAELL